MDGFEQKRFYFPLRIKILVSVLVLITVVVSAITFTMATLFQTDKAAYIRDLTAVITAHTVEESHALMQGYQERLSVFSRVMNARNVDVKYKSELLNGLFNDFSEFVAVTLHRPDGRDVMVYDAEQISQASLTRSALDEHWQTHPIPIEQVLDGRVYISNSTLAKSLPAFTFAAAFPVESDAENDKVVVSAMIHAHKLMQLASRSGVYETFIVSSDNHVLAHSKPEYVWQRQRLDWLPQVNDTLAQQGMTAALDIEVNGEAMIVGLARTGIGELVVGVKIAESLAFLTSRALLHSLIGVALVLLVVAAILALLGSNQLTRPIKGLMVAAKRVGQGDFDLALKPSSRDELGHLTESFNHMADELFAREQALKEAQVQLVRSEKMAAFGQLGAGIAHEVKNPLAGILGYAQLSLRKTTEESPVFNNLKLIEKETKRCKEIIESLLKFARKEETEFEAVDLTQVVHDAIAIVDHQLTINQVKIVTKLAEKMPPVMANANQIQQVIMNIMINAQQALDGKPGAVGVMTKRKDDGHVEIWIKDNGPGMSKAVQVQIFEPFFTTKSAGKGTGLGMSVSYGIIRDHQGKIKVVSELGKGSTFIITLPLTKASGGEMRSAKVVEEAVS